VIVSLGGRARYRVFEIPADRPRAFPARLVLDLSPARLWPRIPGSTAVRGPAVSRIRVEQYRRTVARVVLDLVQQSRHEVSVRSRPFQVMLSLAAGAAPPAGEATAPTQQAATARRSTPPLAAGPQRIVLDPGHGGNDPGGSTGRGVKEKDITLEVARRLAPMLRSRLGAVVILTRTEDLLVPLDGRTAVANAAEADLFVSIHTNAGAHRDLGGVEVFYLNNTDDQATLRLAALENGLGFVAGSTQRAKGDLSYILSDLIQTGKEQESIALAHRLQEGIVQRLRARYAGVKSRGVQRGPFYVLVGAYMPCVLAEIGFLTDEVEGARLATATYQEEVAEGLFSGIALFLRDIRLTEGL